MTLSGEPACGAGLSVVRGDDEAAAVQPEEAPALQLQNGMADVDASPVTHPLSENPVASPQHLAAAAASDRSALVSLPEKPPGEMGPDPQQHNQQLQEVQRRSSTSGYVQV